MRQQNNHHQSRLRQTRYQWLVGQAAIKTNRSDKTEIKKNLKISGHQQRWSRPLPGAILIPSALLMVADFTVDLKSLIGMMESFHAAKQENGHQKYCDSNRL